MKTNQAYIPLAAVAALLSPINAQASGSFPKSTEVDIISPKSQVDYAPVDNFPVVFAIQNAALAFGLTFDLHWEIHRGVNGADGLDDSGTAQVSTEGVSPPEDPFVMINATKSLAQFGAASCDHHDWLFKWSFQIAGGCGRDGSFDPPPLDLQGSFPFSSSGAGMQWNQTTINQCPTLGGVVTVDSVDGNNCPKIDKNPAAGQPCNVKLNDNDQKSILNFMPATCGSQPPSPPPPSSSPSPSPSATPPPYSVPQSSKPAGPGYNPSSHSPTTGTGVSSPSKTAGVSSSISIPPPATSTNVQTTNSGSTYKNPWAYVAPIIGLGWAAAYMV